MSSEDRCNCGHIKALHKHTCDKCDCRRFHLTSPTQSDKAELKELLGIVKDEGRYGHNYYYMSFPGIESAHIHEDTLNELLHRLTARDNRLVQKARKDQIMRDFLAYSAEGENDESVDIAIREGLLAELEAQLTQRSHNNE